MEGWIHLPRYVDKIRLHLAGRLHPDYQPNLGQGFDAQWLKAAGVTHEQMLEVVRCSITDGEVCDWVRRHVKRTAAEKAAHAQSMLNYPAAGDAAMQERLRQRKAQSGLGHREDIRTFVDYIDADEQRV
jgi:gluconokinase